MMKENAYDFLSRMTILHKPKARKKNRFPQKEEYFCQSGVEIYVNSLEDEVVKTAAQDLQDFLRISMEVDAVLVYGSKPSGGIRISSVSNAKQHDGLKKDGFTILTDENGITILGNTSRGAAQGVYYLEDNMTFEGAPAMSYGNLSMEPMFSPRMVHSGYGLDKYPDEYLAVVAHQGRDAILVFTKDVNMTPDGYMDFNDLIRRAARYGLDVYAYSYIISEMSPESPEAEAYYENSYGRLFRECPGLKGVTLVGESVEFPSKDPNIAPGRGNQTLIDGIPSGKPTAGWWPCEDYPVWLNLIKKIIRKYKSDADIVFWTYNWGSKPETARLKLIESLPTDISLLATFEMFEPRTYGMAAGHCSDYTLAFEGPGAYFKSEAEAAKKRGIRLYSMTNTGGLTWDLGVIPYEPMPYQWIKRYLGMYRAHDEWGLCGIMESHHYGFYPSFISKLSQWAFWEPRTDLEVLLKKILVSSYGESAYEKVDKGLRSFSEAITYFTPNDSDQYGAFRVGPSYPFNLERMISIPSDPKAMFGNRICFPFYSDEMHPLDSLVALRVPQELLSLKKMLNKIEQGIVLLEEIEDKNQNLEELINLSHFIYCSVLTGIHAKEWYLLKCRMNAAKDKATLKEVFDEMEKLLLAERQNTEKTIPLVEADSRLGWEPSMLYMTDKWHLEWKLRQVDYVLCSELSLYRSCLQNGMEEFPISVSASRDSVV